MIIATANAQPPIPKPEVAVRITGLAMMSPTALASAVGNPTAPAFSAAPPVCAAAPVDAPAAASVMPDHPDIFVSFVH
ncbi:hypothetical protein FEP36_05826 [Burkholderia multivorans]|nr:hypothetical protein [Burkholderia multivorans]